MFLKGSRGDGSGVCIALAVPHLQYEALITRDYAEERGSERDVGPRYDSGRGRLYKPSKVSFTSTLSSLEMAIFCASVMWEQRSVSVSRKDATAG